MAVAPSLFMAEESHKFLYNDYTDLAASRDSSAYCLANDLVRVDAPPVAKRSIVAAAVGLSGKFDSPVGGGEVDFQRSGAIKREVEDFEATTDLLDLGADANTLAHALCLLGLGGGDHDTHVHTKKSDLLDLGVSADAAADVLGLVGLDVGLGAYASVLKRANLLDLGIDAHVLANILSLIGLGVKLGVNATVLKRADLLDLGVGADVAADVLGILGLDVGVGADASLLKRRADLLNLGLNADVIANVLGLLGLGVGLDVNATVVKRSDLLDLGLGADVAANVLGLLGLEVDAGADVSVAKRDLLSLGVDANVIANILGLVGLGVKLGAKANVVKRGVDTLDAGAVVTLIKRADLLDLGLSADVIAQVLGLLGLGIGLNVNATVLKRSDFLDLGVEADVAADVLGLVGLDADVGADVSVAKRSVEDKDSFASGEAAQGERSILRTFLEQIAGDNQVVLKGFRGTVPRAHFAVSDVAWVADNLFKVTINFAAQDANQLFSQFQDELTSLVVSGTVKGNGEDVQVLWDGSSSSKISNFFEWSATVLVQASEHNGLFCLPENFAIGYDWCTNKNSDASRLWAAHFDTSYEYVLSQHFAYGRKAPLPKYRLSKKEYAEKRAEATKGAHFDDATLMGFQAGSNVLANYCWPARCST